MGAKGYLNARLRHSYLVQDILHDGQERRSRACIETPFLAESVIVVVKIKHHLFFLRQVRNCLVASCVTPFAATVL